MFCILKASSQHLYMITSNLGGGIFLFAYFQNGGKRVKTKKVAYISKYCFDFDYVYIKLYVTNTPIAWVFYRLHFLNKFHERE